MSFRCLFAFFALAAAWPAAAQPKTAPYPAPIPAPITAQSYFVLDVASGRVLAEKNGHQRMFPASTTKIMTCLVALEHGKLDQTITAGKNPASTGESGIGILEGEQFSLADLIRAALIKSANDACVAIAEGVGGSQKTFVGWMNEKAKELGCRDTHFVNPHGLHDPNHYTSAHDLAVIARAALKQPFLATTARTPTEQIHGNWKVGPQRILVNRNKLLWRWPLCDGLKTGYTHQAGNCLVATATMMQDGQPWRLIGVVMKCGGGQSWPDAQALLTQNFAAFRPQKVIEKGEILHDGPIKGGAFWLEAVSPKAVALPMRGSERSDLTHKTQIFDVQAPVEAGQIVGHVEFFGNGRRLADLPLVARDAIPRTLLAKALPFGNRLALLSPSARILVLGLGCLLAAFVLILVKLHPHGRPRTFQTYQSDQKRSRDLAGRN